MTRLYSRSDWLGKGHTAPTLKQAQTEIYIHYPGSPGTIGRESHSATVSRLRGYHRMHTVTNGWSDIAYNYAVSQNGDVYSLRGRDRQCGGNGGTTTNRRGQAILVLVGNSEQPTQDAIEGVRWAIAHIQEKHPGAKKILGHRDSFEASTACPGNILHGMVRKGVFYGSKKGGGKAPAVPSGGAPKPAPKPASKPKPSVSKAPAFPLPRRKGGLYYYGPPSGPKTSVSGRTRNSGAPGDVVLQGSRWYSKGLKMWQQRMLDRGWSGIGAADGRYGPKTEKVVRQFQKSKGLGVDGKIGPGTWAAAWTEPVT